MKELSLVILAASLLNASSIFAADIAAGKEKTAVCAACHGVDGKAVLPNAPNLSNQKALYIVKQIKDFKNGVRKDPLKAPELFTALTDADIENIAAYYESLK